MQTTKQRIQNTGSTEVKDIFMHAHKEAYRSEMHNSCNYI